MTERSEQRICIKFCLKLEKSCAKTIEMMKKAFGHWCMSNTQIKEWYKRFKDGRTSVDSNPHSGRPSTTTTPNNIERVRLAINEDRLLTVRELEYDVGIPKTSFGLSFGQALHQPPYSPDVVPCDFWLFSRLKMPLKGY
nr:PREDICTED: putative uncharacterized protein FLJ37770 [Megachile rotundata]